MRVLKVKAKLYPPLAQTPYPRYNRKVPMIELAGNWLARELGCNPGDKVLISGHPTNPNALIIERVLL